MHNLESLPVAKRKQPIVLRQRFQDDFGISDGFRIQRRLGSRQPTPLEFLPRQIDQIFNVACVFVQLATEILLLQLKKRVDVFADIPGQPEKQQVLRIGNRMAIEIVSPQVSCSNSRVWLVPRCVVNNGKDRFHYHTHHSSHEWACLQDIDLTRAPILGEGQTCT